MSALSFTDDEIRDRAVELGLIEEGEDVPARLRARVAASLVDTTPTTGDEPITVRVEISLHGELIGAATVQVPLGAATT